MKQKHVYAALAIIFGLWAIIGLLSCSNSAGSAINNRKVDTSIVMAKYVTPAGDDVASGELIRYIFTVLIPDSTNLSKNKVTKDTSYAAPAITYVKDSLRNTFLLDSTGKPIRTVRYWIIPKANVWDSGMIVDSTIHNKLMKLRKNPQGKGDTLAIKEGQ